VSSRLSVNNDDPAKVVEKKAFVAVIGFHGVYPPLGNLDRSVEQKALIGWSISSVLRSCIYKRGMTAGGMGLD